MKSIPRELARKFAFDWRDEPVLKVQPGEVFEVETEDASTGFFRSPEDKAIPYTAIVIVVTIVLYVIIAGIADLAIPSPVRGF